MLKNIPQTLYDLSRQGNKRTFLRLLKESSILQMSPEYTLPKDVCLLITSFAVLRLNEPRYWSILEHSFHLKKDEMNARDFAGCTWGFSKSPFPVHQKTWDSLEHGINQNLFEFTAKELVHVCFSLNQSKRNWEQLKQAILRQINFMTAQDISSMTMSISRAGINDEKIWAIFEKKVFLEIKNLSMDNVAYLMNSFAKVQRGSNELWELFENTVTARQAEVDPKSISFVCQALKKVGRQELGFWSGLTNQIGGMLKESDFQNVMSLISSIGPFMEKKDFKELVENHFNNDEVIASMHYPALAALAKTLFLERIQNSALWDRIACRMRHVLKETTVFQIRVYSFFIAMNPVYWNFICETSVLLFIDTANRDPKPLTVQTYCDLVDLTFFCTQLKLGSMMFWKEVGRFLQDRQFDVSELNPLIIAKLMHIISRKLSTNQSMQSRWLSYEKEIFSSAATEAEYIENLKVLLVLIPAFFDADRPIKLLKTIEHRYEEFVLTPKEVALFIMKFLSPKKETKEMKAFIKQEIGKLDFEIQKEIFNGILENWFNVHLNRKYPPNKHYQEFSHFVSQHKLGKDKANMIMEDLDEKAILLEEDTVQSPEEILDMPPDLNGNSNEINTTSEIEPKLENKTNFDSKEESESENEEDQFHFMEDETIEESPERGRRDALEQSF